MGRFQHCGFINARIIVLITAGLFLFQAAPAAARESKPLSSLLKLTKPVAPDAPFNAFGKFKKEYSPKIQTTNIAYFKSHPKLMARIRSDLGGTPLHWRLKGISQRLRYLSEDRADYLSLYETYCNHVISEILARMQLKSPYAGIVTLSDQSPRRKSGNGLYAYIVQDLDVEYRASYEFRNASNKAVVINLSGNYPSGEVGSYSSYLALDAKGHPFFTHNNYTIWQDSGRNPYTVLMTPVEETLHILVRKATESAIKKAVAAHPDCSVAEAEKIVASWIQVEETIVGGLVHGLLPPILKEQLGPLPTNAIEQDLEAKEHYKKYALLRKGIQVVADLGCKNALHLYLADPAAFKHLLNQPTGLLTSAG